MKERITITIDDEMLREIDAQVDGVTIKNRSHAIELSLAKVIKRRNIRQAVILAGGSYTIIQDRKEIPSFMAIVNSKTVLEHNILMLKRQGITDIILAVYYKKEVVKAYFKDGTHLGINLTYIEETEPLGTSGVLKAAAPYINGPFIMTNGDDLKKIDIRDMYEFHRKQGTMATIAVTTVTNPKNYGVVILNGNRVRDFIEKPKENIPTNLINAGLYIFEPEVINQAPQGYGRLEEDVFPKLTQQDELAGYIFFGAWQDIQNTENIEDSIKNWQQQQKY